MIEIIPAGQSAVVTEGDRGSKHPDRYDIVKQVEVAAVASALAAAHTDEVAGDSFSTAQKQVSDAATATVVGFKDAAATAYQLQGQSLLDSSKNASAMSVQSQKESDGLSGQAISNFNLASVQAVSNFNSLITQTSLMQYNILLDSQKNAAAIAAQVAECCCETKLMFAAQTANVLADGQKTRDLINSIEVADLREKLLDAKARARRRTYVPAAVGTLVSVDDD